MSNFNFVAIEGTIISNVRVGDTNILKLETNRKDVFGIILTGGLADKCEVYLRKGSRCLVSGNITTDDKGHPLIEGKEVNFLLGGK